MATNRRASLFYDFGVDYPIRLTSADDARALARLRFEFRTGLDAVMMKR